MRISQAFPSKYLKESDLDGREVTVSIKNVEMESITEDEEDKPVMYFLGKKKGMMLNRTNSGLISHAYGDDTDDWLGKEIIIYPTTCEFRGRTVPCLRVRVPTNRPENTEEPPF